MKTTFIFAIGISLALSSPAAFAEESGQDDSGVIPVEQVETPAESSGSNHPPSMGDEEKGGWAIVDENGNVSSVIVCTPSVCGSGTFGGNRVVFQTHSNDSGNVVGINDAVYNNDSGKWMVNSGGSTYELSSSYPEQYGYKPENYLTCITNCKNNDDTSEQNIEESALAVENIENKNSFENTETNLVVKNGKVFLGFSDKQVVVKIVAKKNKNKKVWFVRSLKEKNVTFIIPKKFRSWKIFATVNKEIVVFKNER